MSGINKVPGNGTTSPSPGVLGAESVEFESACERHDNLRAEMEQALAQQAINQQQRQTAPCAHLDIEIEKEDAYRRQHREWALAAEAQHLSAEARANTHLGLASTKLGEDLSIVLVAEAARRAALAMQHFQHWEGVRQALHNGDLKALTLRDLKQLLDPNAK